MQSKSINHFLTLLSGALPYKRSVMLQFLLMGFSVGFGLLKPWPLKILVDNVVQDHPMVLAGWTIQWDWQLLLLAACLAYLVFHAGESLIQVGSGMVATLTSSKMIRDLRAKLLDRLQLLSLRFHDSHRVGDLVHRVTYNSTAVETAFQAGFMGAVKSVVMLIGMFIIMLLMNVLLTLVALVVIPFLLITIRWYAKKTHKASFIHQTQEGKVSSLLQEILSSIRLVKAYDRHQVEQDRFEESCSKSVETRLKSTLVQKSFGFFTAAILAAGTALLFWVGIREVKGGALTIGEFLVFNAYLAMLYSPLSVLSYTTTSIQSALGGGSRLFEILDADIDVEDPENPVTFEKFQQKIEVRDLRFGYEQNRPVLNKVNLEIAKGEMIAIVGETGGGKSTLLSLLLRFYDPWEGSILLDGTDFRQITLADLRRQFSYVMQDTILLSDSVRENIAFGRPDATEADIRRAARLAHAHEFIEKMENGFDTMVGERGIRLSMGQRQRLSIARAIVKDAPIFLLDEPTSALDGETEARIMENLAAMKDKTLIIVAHRLSTIRGVDRIVLISDGNIAEAGPHEELLAADGKYARLWKTQVAGYTDPEEAKLP